jgi:hypothetical protein
MNVLVTSKKCWLAGWVKTRFYWGPRWLCNFLNFAKESYYCVHIFKLAASSKIINYTCSRKKWQECHHCRSYRVSTTWIGARDYIITFADEADALLPCFSQKKGSSRVGSYTGRERMGNGWQRHELEGQECLCHHSFLFKHLDCCLEAAFPCSTLNKKGT